MVQRADRHTSQSGKLSDTQHDEAILQRSRGVSVNPYAGHHRSVMSGGAWHAACSGSHNRPMTWISPEPPHDPPSPDTGDIRPILQGYLDNQRLTLLRICAGLTADQLALRSTPPSTLSLLGLVRHLTKVERTWLRIRAAGEDVPPLFPTVDEDFNDLDPATAEQAIAGLPAEWAACGQGGSTVATRTLLRRPWTAGVAWFHLHPSGRGVGPSQRARRPDPRSHRRDDRSLTPRSCPARTRSDIAPSSHRQSLALFLLCRATTY